MSDSARNLVAAILSNDELINTLANACTGQNTGNRIQYRSTDEEVHSLFHRGRPSAVNITGQAVPAFQTNINTERNMPSTSQGSHTAAPIYNLRPFTRKGPRQKR